ncbi:hypothetical protein MJO29_008644 [Puccinia striiformis f. sp. tritici]|uniref:hypothetical protein n=1 Tax=Puccinia striiformis f. sp. tritici TaxID=168172 RepID=UPI002008984E|nr:hypothetical protein Pst134EA_015193 [Puccinia striiformis f. sp. tritici]KAH9463110.1 hypothetical protein Pst134EA_015193 [Puccinia striiformis f. sp. tritici]KAI7953013.1 hypothetical protein MJO29_008644 [Puccinia striiformis f. sp. tritici]KAI9603087.1 hypothetical protein H4Q26_002399 [Puccinia striiformis f. sp. tritici PST-130]KAI9606375.1 hypothetical protein KEM48_001887 [Puccinia striiformis f. sp. tritici PST-130]
MTQLKFLLGLFGSLLATSVLGAGISDEDFAKLPEGMHIIKADKAGLPYVDPVTNEKFQNIQNKLDKEIMIHNGRDSWIIEPRQNVHLDYDPNHPYFLITDNETVLLTKDSYKDYVTDTAIERLKEKAGERPTASPPTGCKDTSDYQHEEWYENLTPDAVQNTEEIADKSLPIIEGESQRDQSRESSRATGSGGEQKPQDAPMKEIQNAPSSRPVEPMIPVEPIHRGIRTGRWSKQRRPIILLHPQSSTFTPYMPFHTPHYFPHYPQFDVPL